MAHPLDPEAARQARTRQSRLTKPLGALGQLEDWACWFAARQGREIPAPLEPRIVVFAGDHGVSEEGVSAYPASVTAQMVACFVRGEAAISVLARQSGAALEVVDVGVAADLSDLDGVIHRKVRAGTRNLAHGAALEPREVSAALQVGAERARDAREAGVNLLVPGEMGIGNTTPSACWISLWTGREARDVVGRGTGIDAPAEVVKRRIVSEAVARLKSDATPELAMAELGGLELCAMAGLFLEAARLGVPCLVDGFGAAAAALAARALDPGVAHWLFASHLSVEPGHAHALRALGLEPFLDLGLRLGEGSGAALLLPLLRAALALHAEMFTFEEAGVSGRLD